MGQKLLSQKLRVLILAALLVIAPSQLVIVVEDPGSFPYIMAAGRQSAEVRRAMRYHGTGVAFADGPTWYFRNKDGKVCRLFNKGYRHSRNIGG
jgi:hypothetical protein